MGEQAVTSKVFNVKKNKVQQTWTEDLKLLRTGDMANHNVADNVNTHTYKYIYIIFGYYICFVYTYTLLFINT